MPRRICTLSGGIGSWAAARRVVDRHGTADVTLLFTDTLWEDSDLYRFLVEAAANLLGEAVPAQFTMHKEVPPIANDDDAMARRVEFIKALAVQVREIFPWLVWIIEGRTPWQVFRDERFLGNSRVDPCSKILKREPADRWLDQNCLEMDTVVYVGIDTTEEHRFAELRDRRAVDGWRYEAPLCEAPEVFKLEIFDWLKAAGIASPTLYAAGYAHNNCGGFCIKAGHGHYANRLTKHPERFALDERQEQGMRDMLGRDVSILTDRSGDGVKKPMPLSALRRRIEGGGKVDRHDLGGCGCFAGPA